MINIMKNRFTMIGVKESVVYVIYKIEQESKMEALAHAQCILRKMRYRYPEYYLVLGDMEIGKKVDLREIQKWRLK